MQLPTKRSGISKDWKSQKFLMIGMAGIGKSDFWQHAENPLYIEAEAGLNFIDACKVQCRGWNDVKEIITSLNNATKANEFNYDLLIVDTIDRILNYAEQETLDWAKAKYSKSNIMVISDIPNGAGWDIRRQLLNKFLKAIEPLPCAKALIGHVEDKQIEEMGQNQYHKQTISIGGKIGGDILAWSDHTLHIAGILMGDELKRTVYTKPTKSREAKSRGGIVRDGWKWSADSKDNFAKLREQFN